MGCDLGSVLPPSDTAAHTADSLACDGRTPSLQVGPDQDLGADPDAWVPFVDAGPLDILFGPGGGWYGSVTVVTADIETLPDADAPVAGFQVGVIHDASAAALVDVERGGSRRLLQPLGPCQAGVADLIFYPSTPPPELADDNRWIASLDGASVTLQVSLYDGLDRTLDVPLNQISVPLVWAYQSP